MSDNLKEKVSVVIGGGGGIGRGISLALAKAGATVVVCEYDKKNLEETKALIAADNGICSAYQINALSYDEVADTMKKVMNQYNKIASVIVTVGGTANRLHIGDYPSNEMKKDVDFN